MEVPEAGDWILVRLADDLTPPRLQDAANIGQGRLLGVGSPGGRRGGRGPGVAAVVEHPVDGEGDPRAKHGPRELPPHRGGPVAAGGAERAPDRRVERGGLRRPRRGELVGGDRGQELMRRRGHALRALELLLLMLPVGASR